MLVCLMHGMGFLILASVSSVARHCDCALSASLMYLSVASKHSPAFAVSRTEAGGARLWTFGGTRANRSIAKQVQSLVEIRRVDAIGLDLKTPIDPETLTTELWTTALQFSDHEIEDLAKPIKFCECLPVSLLLQIIQTRQFEKPIRVV